MANDKLPDTRVNLTYKDATDGAMAEKELPLRMLVVGDFTSGQNAKDISERKPLDITPYNFDDRLAEMKVKVDVNVADKLSEEDGAQLTASLKFNSLEDFQPHRVVDQVDALRKLRDVREALEQLKTAFLNEKDFRKRLNEVIQDAGKVEAILGEVKKP